MKRTLTRSGLWLPALLMLLFGCSDPGERAKGRTESPPPAAKLGRLLQDSDNAAVVETVADALPIWRRWQGERPVLLLFSNKPLLPPLPQSQAEWKQFAGSASDAELVRRCGRPVADPLLRPAMVAAAMLQSGAFSRVVWVVPIPEGSALEPEKFVEQWRSAAPGWGRDLDTFRAERGRIAGSLANTPVDVVTADQLDAVAGPLVVHIDTGYFQPLYRGEIKAPLYNVVRRHLGAVARQGYRPLAVTVSRDTLFDDLPLETRWLAEAIAGFVAHPERLQKPDPLEIRRSEVLYIANFFSNDQILEASKRLVTQFPGDASANFAMYMALRDVRNIPEALLFLKKAVALDPLYAFEYAAVIDRVVDKKLNSGQTLSAAEIESAVEYYGRAVAALPDDPFLLLRKAELLVMLGRGNGEVPALLKARQLPWSPVYYPGMQERIDVLLRKAQQHPAPG